MPDFRLAVATAAALAARLTTMVIATAGGGSVLAQAQQIPADGKVVHRMASGLRYSVLDAGPAQPVDSKPAHPKPGDRVRFHYSGWMADSGVLFETSRRGAEPKEQILGVAMPRAWVEALQLMTPGQRIKVFAPAELCFGEWGSPGNPPEVPPVPPGTDVLFEFELVSFTPGITLPQFRLPVLARQRSTDSGLRYETLVEGAAGPTPRDKGRFTVEFAMFNERAQLVVTSRLAEVHHIVGRLDGKLEGPAFLAEAIAMLTVGRRMRFEVPPNLCYGKHDRGYLLPPDSRTIWELELLALAAAPKPRKVPEFTPLDLRQSQLTASGLRYQVVEAGEGAQPGAAARVEIHFGGWLINGKRFDESFSGGVPLALALDDAKVIPGLVEGIRLMRVGAVYRFVMPPRLAYGLLGRRDRGIGPNRRLCYQVELLAIIDP